MLVSVIVPVLNEGNLVSPLVSGLRAGLQASDELLVIDGGSSDDTVLRAREAGAQVLVSAQGRGNQMNIGAGAARGDVLVFVHADTLLPHGFRSAIAEALADESAAWGRFDLRFDEAGFLLAVIARLISLRSRLFRSATGDQAIFVRRSIFESVGAYRELLLFEDVDLVRRLRWRARMVVPRGFVVTSSRRWRNRGVWRTTLKMWTLKSLYLAGMPSARLARFYSDER